MKKPRIIWIDTARGISIFLVVLGHTILPYSWLIYVFSFHIPFFFFLSGYIYDDKKYPTWFSFIKRKANSLLLPYLIFFLLNYVYWIIRFNSRDYLKPFYWLIYSSDKLQAPFIPLWFLTCLFLVEIIFYLLKKYLNKFLLPILAIISLFFGIWLGRHHYSLPWSADIALIAIFFYYLGFITNRFKKILLPLGYQRLGLICLLFLILNYFFAFKNYQISIIYRVYGANFYYFIFASIFGVLGYLLLARILKMTILNKISVFEFLGQNSIIILGLHTITYYFVNDFFNYQLHIHPANNILFAFIYTIITLSLITPFIYLFNSKFPLLIGKKLPQISSD